MRINPFIQGELIWEKNATNKQKKKDLWETRDSYNNLIRYNTSLELNVDMDIKFRSILNRNDKPRAFDY